MRDYLDPDVAYLMGLLVGRGEISETGRYFTIRIEFPFVNPKLENYDQFSGFIESIAGKILPRMRTLLGNTVELSVLEKEKLAAIKMEFPVRHLIVRNIKLILGSAKSGGFSVPKVIQESDDDEIVIEFIRGFADVSGNIRRSNRDQNNIHRVFLDVLNRLWRLPVQICNILQDRLNVPVQSILWAHPNLRGNALRREHQIRVYATDFLKIGFYIEHKQKVLELLSNETPDFVGKPCEGCPRKRHKPKPASGDERDKSLPKELRTHFNSFHEICAKLGCSVAQQKIRRKTR